MSKRAKETPLVSCLMVTMNRPNLARRAVECFARQSWPNKELVIVDDGTVDYTPMLKPYMKEHSIHYHRIEKQEGCYLGWLRNQSLDLANGDYWIQWDDDEWYDPLRIETQMNEILRNGWAGCVLKNTLMHLDRPEHVEHPYRTGLFFGTPGTICHERTEIRYPNTPKGEDSVFLRRLRGVGSVGMLAGDTSYLFVRCFHGSNTWDEKHFTERLHAGPVNFLNYLWAKYVRGTIHAHRLFKLSENEKRTAGEFLAASRELGLITS